MRRIVMSCIAAAVLAAVVFGTVPDRLSDQEFWKLVSDSSEPGGYFRSADIINLTSNEMLYEHVLGDLVNRTKLGGVYLGVGPEQNFTYIAAIKPRIAVIFDIRRGNLMAHLMYKALFELSPTRADFVGKLFSRARPVGLDTNSTAKQIFDAYIATPYDSALFQINLAAIKKQLVEVHGYVMSDSDSKL